ncbi:cytochrome P450 [Colletotrichum tofieldiae]|nr:cytochrome P450 [Colletotrichum tofieldiae]GKT81261.1 cytochrome P450 [Colletotrichum tofieldiae]
MGEALVAQFAYLGTAAGVSCALAAVAGLLSHWLYFIRGNRTMETVNIILFYIFTMALLLFKTTSSQGLYHGIISYAEISGSYFLALFTSIGVYRLFLHPLRRFPGPFPAKITKLHTTWQNRDWKLHRRYLEMHEKYGDVVRVGPLITWAGPNDISIVNLEAFANIHGPQTKCTKRNTGFYDASVAKGELNLDALWHNEQHRDRRRVWDQALGTLERYEAETRTVLRTFLSRLEQLQGIPINATLYAKLIPFDNMGRVGYGRDFRTVHDGREDRMLDLIESGFKAMARLGQTSWLVAALMMLPRIGMMREFEELGERLVDERISADSDDAHDMIKYFLADLNAEKPKSFHNINVMYNDSKAILVGATDTIACALAHAFFFIARDANFRRRLYDDIATAHGKTLPGEFTIADLNKLEFLDAAIHETLRIQAPAALNGPRMTPPEGIVVDGEHIPGGVTLCPKYWKRPNEFIPERWTTRPDLILDRRAFVPFSFGRFDCVGRRLAFNVLRLAIAYTLWNFDFSFAPGEDGRAFEEEAKFQLIIKPGKLDCVFIKRPEAAA